MIVDNTFVNIMNSSGIYASRVRNSSKSIVVISGNDVDLSCSIVDKLKA